MTAPWLIPPPEPDENHCTCDPDRDTHCRCDLESQLDDDDNGIPQLLDDFDTEQAAQLDPLPHIDDDRIAA